MAGRKTTKTLSRVYGQQMDLLNQAKKDLAKAKKEIERKQIDIQDQSSMTLS